MTGVWSSGRALLVPALSRLRLQLDIKAVSAEERRITGYAAVFRNTDRVGDIIDPKAFARCLAEKTPAEIAVFVGHKTDEIPVGVPVSITADDIGLLTVTEVVDGPVGDHLLAAARQQMAHGSRLGMSIGYYIRDYTMEQGAGGVPVRRLTDIDLVEYSYAARQTIANPEALVVGVKTAEEAPLVDGLPKDLTALAGELAALATGVSAAHAAMGELGLDTDAIARRKAGRAMSARNQAQMHGAVERLMAMHAATCDQGDTCGLGAAKVTPPDGDAETKTETKTETDDTTGGERVPLDAYRVALMDIESDLALSGAARTEG